MDSGICFAMSLTAIRMFLSRFLLSFVLICRSFKYLLMLFQSLY